MQDVRWLAAAIPWRLRNGTLPHGALQISQYTQYTYMYVRDVIVVTQLFAMKSTVLGLPAKAMSSNLVFQRLNVVAGVLSGSVRKMEYSWIICYKIWTCFSSAQNIYRGKQQLMHRFRSYREGAKNLHECALYTVPSLLYSIPYYMSILMRYKADVSDFFT